MNGKTSFQIFLAFLFAVILVVSIFACNPTKAGAQTLSQEDVERVREERNQRDLELNKRFWAWFQNLKKLEPDPAWMVRAKRALVASKLHMVTNEPKVHFWKGALLPIFPDYQPIGFEVFRPEIFALSEGRRFPKIVLLTGDFRALLMQGSSSLSAVPRLADLEYKVFWLAGGGRDTTVLQGSFSELLEIAEAGDELLPFLDRGMVLEPFRLLGHWASADGSVRWEIFDGLFKHQPRVANKFNRFEIPMAQTGNFRNCDSRVNAQSAQKFLEGPVVDVEILVGWCFDYANKNVLAANAASLGIPVEVFSKRNLGNASVAVDSEGRLVLSGREARIVFNPVKQKRVLSQNEPFKLEVVEEESNDIIAVSTSSEVFTVYRAGGRWLVFPEPIRTGSGSPFAFLDEVNNVSFEGDGVLVFVEGASLS